VSSPGDTPVDPALASLFAEPGAVVSVERFMRAALYDPAHGYYARRIRAIGAGGDFSTVPSLHPILGRAVAAWARDARKAAISGRGRAHLIEIGAGEGRLAAGVLDALGMWGRRAWRYHVVEASPELRRRQQDLVASSGVEWHDDMALALAACGGRALVVSNELADAFPVALFRWDGAAWREVGLALGDDGVFEVEAPRGPDRPASSALAAGHGPAAGQRVEVAFAWREWLETWTSSWTEGRMLTIDYGDTFPELYHRRPEGTLRAYFLQQRLTGREVYRRFGRQDLTADVNFSDLQAWGEELGLETVGCLPLHAFLSRHVPRAAREVARDPLLARLLDASGAGGAFKVLDQARARRPPPQA
jgi:SAM-dependent MidA family methyltransferase